MKLNNLPSTWKIARLGDVAEYINGFAFKPTDWGETGLPIIRIQNLNSPNASFNYFDGQIADKFKVQNGDLLISWSASLDAFLWNRGEAVLNQHIFNVREDSKVITRKYFYYVVRDAMAEIRSHIHGATMQHITKPKFEAIKIPLPPLPEQKRIAEVLDKADVLREKRRLALQKLDTLLQSVFLEMFGDPVKNPKGWKKGVLGDVIYSAKDGPHVSPNYVDEGIPFLSTRHIKPGKVVWEDLKHITAEDALIHWRKCKPEKGDILYTKGGTTGIATMVNFDREVAVWVHVALLKTNHNVADALWLENMLNSRYCYVQSQRYTHGIANRDLGLKRMVNIEMYIPPLEEQRKFSDFAMRLKSLENKIIKALEDSEILFQSLQQRAFKGGLFNDEFPPVELQGEKVWEQSLLF